MFKIKKLTKKQKQNVKKSLFLIFFVVSISYISYYAWNYMWKNNLNINDAKKQLWIVKKDKPDDVPFAKELMQETNKEKKKITKTLLTEKPDNTENTNQYDDSMVEIKSNINLNNLPVWTDFWTPVSLWDSKFTYSDLKWLEVKYQEYEKKDVNCWNITEFLQKDLNTWFYWNTCRKIVSDDDGISFYVIKLSDDKEEYIYEKHYILYKKWYYWIHELLSWISVDKENISMDIQAQNSELREKNTTDFPVLEIVDNLFYEIVKN